MSQVEAVTSMESTWTVALAMKRALATTIMIWKNRITMYRAVVGQTKQQEHHHRPIMQTAVGPSRGVQRLTEKDDTHHGREKLEMDVVRIRPLMKILRCWRCRGRGSWTG